MLITEMIAQLEELKEEHGDLDVIIPTNSSCYLYGWVPAKFVNLHKDVETYEGGKISAVSIDNFLYPPLTEKNK